ncbi:MAG: polysaccharide biosynthesis tyrosine autokinase [Candidatus Hydrothermales bacterium]
MTPETYTPIDVRKYLDALWKRKWVFLLFFLGVPAVTMVFTFATKPVYEARAVLIARTSEVNPFNLGSYQNPIKNQIYILNTVNFAEKVWNRINEDEVLSKNFALFLKDGDPVFNIKSKISYTFDEQNNLLYIKVRGNTPKETAMLCNTVAEVFIKTSEEIAKSSAQEVVKFLEEQIPKVEANLQKIQDSLKNFKIKEKITDIKSQGEYLSGKLKLIDEMFAKVEVDIREREGILKAWEKRREDLVKKISEGEGSGTKEIINALYEKIIKLETQKTSLLLEGFSEDSKEIRELEEGIKQVKRELKEKLEESAFKEISITEPINEISEAIKNIVSLSAELKALQAKREALFLNRETLMKEFSRFPEKEITFLTLQRDFNINEEILMMLKKRYEEAKLQEVGQISSFVIVEPSVTPRFPVYPKKRQNLLFAIVIGFGLALSLVFLLEYLDTRIRDVDEIKTSYPDFPLLATIPMIKINDTEKALITAHKKGSLYMESFRTLRSNLKFLKVGEEVKSILVTSSQPNEGKTTVSINLAIIFQMTNMKAVIMEGDLRKPGLPKIFGEKEHGLTEYLLGETKINDIIYDTYLENLHYIPPGKIPPNPTELISSERFKNLISELKKEFDIILVDSPPLTLFVDAAVIASHVDGSLVVLQFEYTRRETLDYAISSLLRSGGKILGFVANKVTPSPFKTRAYYYYPYYRSYKEYGYNIEY